MTSRTVTYMRHIDTVTVKGSIEPMEMWTCDVDLNQIQVEPAISKKAMRSKNKKMDKVRERIWRNRFKEACFSNQVQVSDKFETDEDI